MTTPSSARTPLPLHTASRNKLLELVDESGHSIPQSKLKLKMTMKACRAQS